MVNQALQDAIKTLVQAGKDVVAAAGSGQSLSQRVAAFENLIPELMSEYGESADIVAGVKAVTAADVPALAGILVTDVGFQDSHAQAIAQAALKVLGDAASNAVPDLLALLHAIKNPPVAAVPAA